MGRRKNHEGKKNQVQNKSKEKINIDEIKNVSSVPEKENLTSVPIYDNNGECTVVIVTLNNQRIYNKLQLLKDLPDNITLVTKETLFQFSHKKKNGRKSREASKSRKRSASKSRPISKTRSLKNKSGSKTSDKSMKTKTGTVITTANRKRSKEDSRKSDAVEKARYDDLNSAETCSILKEFIDNFKSNYEAKHIDQNISPKTPKSGSLRKTKKEKSIKLDTEKRNTISTEQVNNEESSINHRYVVLWGFNYPNVPEHLTKSGIRVTALIDIKETNDDTLSPLKTSKIEINDKSDKSRKTRNLSQTNKLINDKAHVEDNKDVIFLVYNSSSNSQENHEYFKLNFLNILDNIKQAWDRFEEYCDTVQVIEIPFDEQFKLENAMVYTTMISMVPLESVNIPTIIHCMLEQIVWWNGEKDHVEENNSLFPPSQINFRDLDREVENITPVIIYEGDDVRYDTFHLNLSEFDFESISTNMFLKSPLYRIWENYPCQTLSKSKWYDYHLKKLRGCTENYSNELLILYLNQAIMKVMVSKCCSNFLKTNNEHFSQENKNEKSLVSYMESKWNKTANCIEKLSKFQNNLYKKEKLQKLKDFLVCPDFYNLCSELLNVKIENKMANCLKDYELVKYNNISTLSQSLQKAFQSFSNVDFYYFAPTDSIIFWFNSFGESHVKLAYNIETKLGFQDFYKYELKGKIIFNEIEMINYNFSSNSNGSHENKSSFIDSSLKTDYGLQTKYNLGPYYMEATEFLKQFSSKDGTYVGVKELKQFSPESRFNVTVKKSYSTISYELKPGMKTSNLKLLIQLHNNMIINCDLKWHKTKSIKTVCYQKLDAQRESINLNAVDRLSTTSMINIKSSLSFDEQNSIRNPISESALIDHLQISDQQLAYPDKQSESAPSSKHTSSVAMLKPNEPNALTLEDEYFQIDSSMSISLPSGLLVQFIPTDSILGPFYIRQSYLNKGPACGDVWEESKRCYLNNGTIIIFFLNDTVSIIHSNGAMIKCEAFEVVEMDIVQQETSLNFDHQNTENKLFNIEENVTIRTGTSDKHINKSKGTNINNSVKSKFETLSKGKKQKSKISTPLLPAEEIISKRSSPEKETTNDPLYKILQYSILSPEGIYKIIRNEKPTFEEKRFTLKRAFDHINQELYTIRSDGMVSFLSPENLTVVFPDRSKITSYTMDQNILVLPTTESASRLHSTDEISHDGDLKVDCDIESDNFVFVETKYVLEHNNYATVVYNNSGKYVNLEFPGSVNIEIHKDKLFHIKINDNDTITLFSDYLTFDTCPFKNSLRKSTTVLKFKKVDTSPTIFCETRDGFGNIFSVDEQGVTELTSSDESLDQQNIPEPVNPETIQRFYVLKRNLTGYELIHRHKLEKDFFLINDEYESVVKEQLVHNSNLCCCYKQTPIYKNKSDLFLMNYLTGKLFPLTKLIRRKDLVNEGSSMGWFNPEMSSVTQTDSKENESLAQMPKAIMTVKMLRIKTNDTETIDDLVVSLEKYLAQGEECLKKYLNFYLDNEKEFTEDINSYEQR